ncbi:MAG: dipeptidase [Anaerolineae bacterium]|jgi:acetylornithine deacetylase/succinyl-diaminopimelate desuccinylase-like protein
MEPLTYARARCEEHLRELKTFLSIPSVSTQPQHEPDMQRAAVWLRDQLSAAGFPRAEIMPTGGHPIVFAEWMAAGKAAPTVLVYGHYDVQPPDPVDEWETPPFEPTVLGDDIFCRGASDDKGQLYVHVKAVEAFTKTVGAPPVNVKCIFEGEEEIGSVHLAPFIAGHREELAADVVVISDSHILGEQIPAIVYAVRGLAYLEVEVTGPDHDLHSGLYGGAVHNPVNALCAMLASLQDEHGRITIPGFYDAVRPLSPDEREELARVPFDRETWQAEAGVTHAWGDPEYTIVERTTARPTFDVNGIWGGYIEPGAKTVLPSKALAKISMRLVPDQKPEEIRHLVTEHLQAIAPPTVTVEVRGLHGGEGAIFKRDSPHMAAAARAYEAGFGVEPVFRREGGSITVTATFQKELGIDTILMGFGLPDDNLHAPNEKLHLPNYYRGIETIIHFLDILKETG